MVQMGIWKLGLLVLLVALLGAQFVLYGAGYGHSDGPPYTADELAAVDNSLEGIVIETSGTVIETDPVVIEVTIVDTERTFVVEDAPEASVGQELRLIGTLADDSTIVADPERSFTRDPWEFQFMWAISIVGLLVVVLKTSNEWQFHPRQVAFEPRDETLVAAWLQSRGECDG